MNSKDNKSPNRSIECTVSQCEYHCQNKDYCSLDTVNIGTHEPNPTVVECVDCESFVSKYETEGQTSSQFEGQTSSQFEGQTTSQYDKMNQYEGQTNG